MRPVLSPRTAEALKAQIEAFLATEDTPELSRMHIVRRPNDLSEDRMPLFQRVFLEHALAGPA